MPRKSKREKSLKYARSCLRRSLPPEIDNGLSVEEEWDLLIRLLPDDEDDENPTDDCVLNDGDDFDNILEASRLLVEQCAAVCLAEECAEQCARWRQNGSTSNLRGRGNGRSTYYKSKQKDASLKLKAKGTADIRGFFDRNVSI